MADMHSIKFHTKIAAAILCANAKLLSYTQCHMTMCDRILEINFTLVLLSRMKQLELCNSLCHH